MKKKLRICVTVICVCVIAVLCRSIYWYYELEGMNVPIIISTQYSEIPTSIEVYIDDKSVFKDDSLQTLYTSTRIHLSCGIHQLRVVLDDEELIESFLVLPVRWIYIEVQKEKDGPNYKMKDDWIFIEFSSSPIVLM